MNDEQKPNPEPSAVGSALNEGLGGGWNVMKSGHVMPVDDLFEHTESVECWCKPTNDDGVIIHHSRDGRELFETDYRPEINRRTADA